MNEWYKVSESHVVPEGRTLIKLLLLLLLLNLLKLNVLNLSRQLGIYTLLAYQNPAEIQLFSSYKNRIENLKHTNLNLIDSGQIQQILGRFSSIFAFVKKKHQPIINHTNHKLIIANLINFSTFGTVDIFLNLFFWAFHIIPSILTWISNFFFQIQNFYQ